MVSLRDLWDNTKPAAADTPTAGGQNNSHQHDEEIIDFEGASDAENEAQARQLTAEQLGGGYEIIGNSSPAAAAAPAALAATIITQTQTATTPITGRKGPPTPTPAALTTPAPGASARPTPQSRNDPLGTSDSALLRAVTLRWNAIKGDQAAILQEYTWQMEIDNDTAKGEAFKQDVLQVSPRLRLFALMQENSVYIQFVFGVAAYNDVMGPTTFRGKVLGFVGDRTTDSTPDAIVLSQPDNTWKWKKCKVVFDETAFVNYYSVEDNRDGLWVPDAALAKTDKWLPRLLLVPSNVAMELVGRPCTPWDYYKAITKVLISPTCPITPALAALHKNWAIAASQTMQNKQDTSLVYLELGAAVSPHKYFREWKQMMINLALGENTTRMTTPPTPSNTTSPAATYQPNSHEALLLQALTKLTGATAQLAQNTSSQGNQGKSSTGDTLKEEKTKLSDHQIAALMGYCGVRNPGDIPAIWTKWEVGSTPMAWRSDLMEMLKEAAKKLDITLERNLFFPDQTMKDFVKVQMNPGGARATITNVEKGMTMMTCRPRSATEVESLLNVADAVEQSAKNRTLQESLQIKMTDGTPRRPPANYHELVTCIGTFTCLLYVTFGQLCSYFTKVRDIYHILISNRVEDIKWVWTPLKCRQLTWVIIEEGRAFFGTQLHPNVFAPGATGPITWPGCLLQRVNDEVMLGLDIFRHTFPKDWQEKAKIDPKGGSAGQTKQFGGNTAQANHSKSHLSPPGPPGSDPFAADRHDPSKLDHVHPRIREALAPFHQAFGGRIPMAKILRAGGKEWKDLPFLQRCITSTGRNHTCYQYVGGICSKGLACDYLLESNGHPDSDELEKAGNFITHFLDTIMPGVTVMLKRHSAGGTRKSEDMGNGGGGEYPAKKTKA